MNIWQGSKTRNSLGLAVIVCAVLLGAATLTMAPQMEAQAGEADTGTAIFAGGCFWCVEEAFDKVGGVTSTTSGYIGGHVDNPTYKQVSGKGTGHKEAVRVRFNPRRVTYEQLLDVYWRNVDPFDARGQFCDKGDSYKAVIFVMNDAQRETAEASKKAVEKRFGRGVATRIQSASTFWPAEGYHQNYYNTNPVTYKYYKWRCGRAQRLEQVWGKPSS